MKLKTLLTIYAVIGLLFGLGFLLVPEQLISSYAVSLGEPGKWVGRYFGATLIGISILAWSVRNVPYGEASKGIILGLTVGNLLGLIVGIFDVIDAAGNWMDWLNLLVYLFFTVSFGYFQFVKAAKP